MTVSNRIFKLEGAVTERFASCIVVRSVVEFRLIMPSDPNYTEWLQFSVNSDYNYDPFEIIDCS